MKVRKKARRPWMLEELEPRTVPSASVLGYHNDNSETGQNLSETILTPNNVNTSTFGKLFSETLDGQVYAQPLVQSGVNIPSGPNRGVHNIVFIATEHDSLYAFDGDTGKKLWQDSFLTGIAGAIVTPVPVDDLQEGGPPDIAPEIGITGTPVIDGATNTLYVIARTKEVVDGVNHYVQRLHAVSTIDGSEKFGGPTTIADTSFDGTNYTLNSGPSVSGTGAGADDTGTIVFNALRQNQRAALTLAGGKVYAAWSGHYDANPYHGWVLGFDAATLQLKAVFNDTPNGSQGGIWESGAGLVADSSGYLYLVSGNGDFDTNLDDNGFPVNGNYGDSLIKLAVDPTSSADNPNVNGWGVKVVDYFTPHNQADLNAADLDLGSGGIAILPDAVGTTAHPHLLAFAGKEGTIYLVDRDNLGKYDDTTDNVVQSLVDVLPTGDGNGASFDTPAFYQNKLYYVAHQDVGRTFGIANGSAQVSTSPGSMSSDPFGLYGSTPSISADGSSNGIVWDLDRGANQLRAYDAQGFDKELYTSDQASGGRDTLGSVVKFSVPTVANGRVFVGTSNSLVIYGLFSSLVPAAPTNLTAAAESASEIDLAWVPGSNNEDGYKVLRSTDNVTFTQVATAPAGATTFADTGLAAKTTYYYRVVATNAVGDSAPSATASATTANVGVPAAPKNLTAISAGQTEIDLLWQRGSTDETGFKISRSTDNVNFAQVGTAAAGAITFVDTNGLAAGTKYYYRVVAFNATGDSPPSNVASATTQQAHQPPAAPTNLTATALSASTINLAWLRGSTNEDGFRILRSADNTNFTQVGTAGAGLTTFSDANGLAALTTYYYRVVAFNAYGDSPASPTASATTKGAIPQPPTSLTATAVTKTEVDLLWVPGSTNQDGFKVLRSTDNVTFTQVATAAAGATTLADTGVARGTTYCYRVVAFNAYGDSLPSPTASATTSGSQPPAAPTGVKGSGTEGHVILSWTPPTGATSYNVYRSTTAGGEGATPLATGWTSTSFTDTGVAKGVTYFYQVTAVGTGGQSARSAEAGVYVFTDNERLVHSLYVDFLGRDGSLAEMDWWASRLVVSGQAGVATAILQSTDATAHLVSGLYVTFLGRAPVGGEEGYWVNQITQGGATIEQVTAGIVASGEFANRANALVGSTDADKNFILGLYNLLLHRPATGVSGAEIASWKGVLTAQGRSGVAAGFLASTEFRTGVVLTLYDGGPGGTAYQPFVPDLLHRKAAPSPAELAFWSQSSLDLWHIALAFASTGEFFNNA
jgi:fibronectin type 3 domain-containing protein